MRREQRLRADGDFQRVRRVGSSWSHPLLVLFAARAVDPGPTRVGITVGRRIGGAVVRNRVRRRISERVRSSYDRLAPGWDVVLVARAAAGEACATELAMAVDSVVRRSGLLEGESG